MSMHAIYMVLTRKTYSTPHTRRSSKNEKVVATKRKRKRKKRTLTT